MSKPTEVRVESLDDTSVIVRWKDDGILPPNIYRSTDGSAYSLVTTVDPGIQIYLDNGLLPNTRYWYKLSTDGGATFTDPLNLIVQACGIHVTQIVQTTQRSDWTTQDLNLLADAVEQLTNKAYNDNNYNPGDLDKCAACVVNGQLILDCTDCAAFVVSVTSSQDITSISLINCSTCPVVDINIVAGAVVGICGMPDKCNASGDECHDAKVHGPATADLLGKSRPLAGGEVCGATGIYCSQPVGVTPDLFSPSGGGPPGCYGDNKDDGSPCFCWWEDDGTDPQTGLHTFQCNDITLHVCGAAEPITWSIHSYAGTCAGKANCFNPNLVTFTPPVTQTNKQTTKASINQGWCQAQSNHEQFFIEAVDFELNAFTTFGYEGI